MENTGKRYEFVADSEKGIYSGDTLKRIRALTDNPAQNVKAGDLGGYIASEQNLLQTGCAWVFDQACVFGKARIGGRATVQDRASVCDEAQLDGRAQAGGNAYINGRAKILDNVVVQSQAAVFDDAVICDDVFVGGNTRIGGNAHVSSAVRFYGDSVILGDARIKSYNDWMDIGPNFMDCWKVTVHRDAKLDVRINCEGFSGGLMDFYRMLLKKSENPDITEKEFKAFRDMVLMCFAI